MTTYLSEARIDFEVAAKRRLKQPYDWHQATWEAFAYLGEDAKRQFLTRVDERQDGYRLLAVSTAAPQRPPWCPEPCWRSREVPEISPPPWGWPEPARDRGARDPDFPTPVGMARRYSLRLAPAYGFRGGRDGFPPLE